MYRYIMSEPCFKHDQIQAIKKRLDDKRGKHGMTTYTNIMNKEVVMEKKKELIPIEDQELDQVSGGVLSPTDILQDQLLGSIPSPMDIFNAPPAENLQNQVPELYPPADPLYNPLEDIIQNRLSGDSTSPVEIAKVPPVEIVKVPPVDIIRDRLPGRKSRKM